MAIRVLVAGATGMVGREVAKECHRRGFIVRTLTRDADRLKPVPPWANEIVVGDVLKEQTLAAACEGVDVVFSSVGAPIMPQFFPITSFDRVDRRGNIALLKAAKDASVSKFVYVGVAGGDGEDDVYCALEYVRAHEAVIEALRDSGLDYGVVRATGFFSAFGEFFRMAKKGRAAIIGDGAAPTNPIHETDLAAVCVDAIEGDLGEVSAGGPIIHTRRECVELAFEVLGRPARITEVPPSIPALSGSMLRLLNPRLGHALKFFAYVSTNPGVADPRGERTLRSYYSELSRV